jgi:lipoate-protein ligase A
MRERGVVLARRRGGGGAVYLGPGEQLWLDAWIPRDDPLWVVDVSAAAEWVGAWWMEALAGIGLGNGYALAPGHFDVHTGRSIPGDLGDLVCFAGRGPGEVFHGVGKVVGLSQWRAREGALFSSCAYLHWDPVPLLALMAVDEAGRDELARDLAPMAIGLAELDPPVADLDGVRAALLDSFPVFGMTPPLG